MYIHCPFCIIIYLKCNYFTILDKKFQIFNLKKTLKMFTKISIAFIILAIFFIVPNIYGAAFKTRNAMCSLGGSNRHTFSHCKTAGGRYYKWKTGDESPCCELKTAAKYRKFIDSCTSDDLDLLDNSAQMTWCNYYCADGVVCNKPSD